MDEEAYRATYRKINQRQCLFEKSILTNQCTCSRGNRLYLAEREAAHCNDQQAYQHCHEFLEVLGEKARFTLKLRNEGSALPHAKAVRLQVGGMRGLYTALHPDQQIPQPIPEVAELLQQALRRFGGWAQLPYEQIIPQIAAYQIKKRRKRRK